MLVRYEGCLIHWVGAKKRISLERRARHTRLFQEQEVCPRLTQGLIEGHQTKVSGSGKCKQIGICPLPGGHLRGPV